MDEATLKNVLKSFQEANQQLLQRTLESNTTSLQRVLSGENRNANAVPVFRAYEKRVEKWSTYIQQMEQHFVANGVTKGEVKRASFLSWVGTETFELLQKICVGNVSEKPFYDIISLLNNHYVEKLHVLAARFKFYSIRMKPHQTYADWVAELRGAARECLFQCSKDDCHESLTEENIRDVVVIHTPHDKVRSAALQKTNPSLEEVLQIASIYESTVKTCLELKGEETTTEVNASNQSKRKFQRKNYTNRSKSENENEKFSKSCPGCNSRRHQRTDCYHYKNKTLCRICSKAGHIAAVCQQKPKTNQRKFRQGKEEKVNAVNEAATTASFETISTVEPRSKSADKSTEVCANLVTYTKNPRKVFMELLVNNQMCKFQIDTGASSSLLGLATYLQLGQPKHQVLEKELHAYGGGILKLKGRIEVDVLWKNEHNKLPLLVVDNKEATNILGLDWCEALELKMSFSATGIVLNECNLSFPGQACRDSLIASLNQMSGEFSEIFSSELGLCKSLKADIKLKENATPKFHKPYNLPFSQYEDVRSELKRLQNIGVLKSVTSSDWAAPIVVVKKPNGKLRICADFKVTINPQIEVDRYPIPRIEELFHKLQGGKFFTKIDLSEAYLQVELSDVAKKFMVINTPFGLFQFQRMPFGVYVPSKADGGSDSRRTTLRSIFG